METFLLSAWFYWFDAYLRDNGRLAALTAAGRRGVVGVVVVVVVGGVP